MTDKLQALGETVIAGIAIGFGAGLGLWSFFLLIGLVFGL